MQFSKKGKKAEFMLCVFFFSVGNGLQIISLIRSAFGGHVTFVFSYIETSLELMPLAWFCFASPACSTDSQLAGGSAPWTPGGYIPILTKLLILVPTILLIPVLNTLEIFNTLYIYTFTSNIFLFSSLHQ